MARNKDYDVTGEPSAIKQENMDAMFRILFEELAGIGGAEPQDVALLDGDEHNDTTAGTPVRGDIISAQGATPTWTRLAKGAENTILAMGANEPGWVAQSSLAFPLAYQIKDADEDRSTGSGGGLSDPDMTISLVAGTYYVRVNSLTLQTGGTGNYRFDLEFSGTTSSLTLARKIDTIQSGGGINTTARVITALPDGGAATSLPNGDMCNASWEGTLIVTGAGDFQLKWGGGPTNALRMLAGSHIAYKKVA